MEWFKRNATLSVVLTALVLFGTVVGAFVRVQVHAADDKQHLSREVLQREYVPRAEHDAREKAIQDKLERMHEDIKENQSLLREHLVNGQ